MTMSIKRVTLSLGMIVFVGAVVVGSTGAFFSDTETSTGNTFTAGAIDLKVDNHAWYNGLECKWYTQGVDGDNPSGWYWYGSPTGDSYLDSLIGEPCESSWHLDDLDGHVFFNLTDLKPGDWEEDTISLHVNNNDAWMCAALSITSNDDRSSTEPELEESGEVLEDNQDPWDGELADELNFIFWGDDGDNVLESDEEVVLRGTPADLIANGEYDSQNDKYTQRFPIADSYFSILGDPGTPIPGSDNPEDAIYIGKAFCFGDLNEDPVNVSGPDDETVNSPADDPGFDCSGRLVTNISQTDGITGDLEFTAIQSRNNQRFSCERP